MTGLEIEDKDREIGRKGQEIEGKSQIEKTMEIEIGIEKAETEENKESLNRSTVVVETAWKPSQPAENHVYVKFPKTNEKQDFLIKAVKCVDAKAAVHKIGLTILLNDHTLKNHTSILPASQEKATMKKSSTLTM